MAQYNTAFEGVIADHGMDAMQAARLYAMANMIGADALTACMNAKYHYLSWRPQFAIPGAADDGNDATTADPAWTPLVKTPTHPEYPSNHACLTTAQAMVLANVLGTDNIDLTVTSSVTADGMPSSTSPPLPISSVTSSTPASGAASTSAIPKMWAVSLAMRSSITH